MLLMITLKVLVKILLPQKITQGMERDWLFKKSEIIQKSLVFSTKIQVNRIMCLNYSATNVRPEKSMERKGNFK